MRVFVTDAGYKHTLGAVRSLGRRGVHVIAGSSSPLSQSFFSKYCREKVIYPQPRNEEAFSEFLLTYLQDGRADVLLPIGYLATVALSKRKRLFDPYVRLPIAEYSSLGIAADKEKTMKFAEGLGISIPRTYSSPEAVESFPVVVKGWRDSGKVTYVNSARELVAIGTEEAVIQEYIPGEGYGFFALFNRGQPRAIFMHRRIREYPVTGGPSTLAESIYDPVLESLGTRLLRSLNWHGVAMVEFKKDSRSGEYRLMEINPKFWGSLDLAIASGVDFPFLAARMALEGDVEPVMSYRSGVRFRWLLPGDLLHLMARPASFGEFLRDFFDAQTETDIWLSDIMPNFLQLGETALQLVSRIRRGSLRYPNGRPGMDV